MEIKFESLITNELFVSKVLKGGAEARRYIDALIEKYPSQEEEIFFAVQFIITISVKQSNSNGSARAEVWKNIMNEQKHKKELSIERRKNIFTIILKVAASIVIILGFSYYFYNQYSLNSFKRIAQNRNISADESILVLSDGTEHKLFNSESRIDYIEEGEKIIIQESDNKSKKIENLVSENKEEIFNQLIVPYGTRQTVTLSDGTEVKLNAGSRLVYPANFDRDKRKVYLTGEGFFKVAENKDKPFIINTDNIDIKVTGTIFNVSAYADEPVTSTVLVEGSVQVLIDNKIVGKSRYNLAPNHGCFYSVNEKQLKVREVNIDDYIGWQDGWMQFKDVPLKNIIKRVEKYYDRKIVIEGEDLKNTLISGKLILSDNFQEVLNYLAKTTHGNFEIKHQSKTEYNNKENQLTIFK